MPILTGIFNTTQNPAELNKRSFAQQIARLFPNGNAPMFAITSGTKKTTAASSSHGYFSKTMTFVAFLTTTTALAGDTTLTIASSAGIVPGTVLHNTVTRENVLVTAVPSATTLTVIRAFGRVAASAIAVGQRMIAAGTAYAEDSNRPVARRLQAVYIPNFTQIFRNAWGLSDTARASMVEIGFDNVTENRRDCGLMHSTDIESAIIWGQPKMDTSGPQPIHTTQGVIDALEQYAPGNTNTAGPTTTYEQLVALVDPAYTFSSDQGSPNERVIFCGSTAMSTITNIGRKYGNVQVMQNETSFGMQFDTFRTHRGTLHVKTHPLFDGLGLDKSALVLDSMALRFAYLNGRDTKSEEYGTNGRLVENGRDGVGGSLTTEGAVELVNPYGCAYIEGLTAAA